MGTALHVLLIDFDVISADEARTFESTQSDTAKSYCLDLIPIRATIISAIFVVPYVVIFRVFKGLSILIFLCLILICNHQHKSLQLTTG